MTNKQRRAMRRQKVRERARKAVQRATAVNMQTVRAQAHTAAREPLERFNVASDRTWYVIRTLPRWSARAAMQIRAAGIPVFEAREAVRLVSDIGKVRVALIPVLRRLLFVGCADWHDLRLVESHPGIYDDLTSYRRGGVVERPGGGHMTIRPADLQNFADCITCHDGDADAARSLLFAIGETVDITEGAFASYAGTVEDTDVERGRVTVSVDIFGRPTSVVLDADQVERAA